jgi:hypothetical protein
MKTQGKLKDARVYFRLRSSWPSILYVAKGKRKTKKTVKEDGKIGRGKKHGDAA